MGQFEFLRQVTIGIYLPGDSILHRLDPRVKLVGFAFLAGAAALAPTVTANLYLLLLSLLLLRLADVSLGFALSGLKPALPFLLMMALLELIFTPPMAAGPRCITIWQWGPLLLSNCVLQLILLIFIRFAVLIFLTSLLTLTTSTTEMGRGTEALLAPLNRFGLPGYELSLVLSLTFRFVPTIALEAERLVKAQLARGADFGESGRWQFVRRARGMLPLTVPLFLLALQRAETMALAMEARGYAGGQGRTHYRTLHWRRLDAVLLVVALCLAIVAFLPFWSF